MMNPSDSSKLFQAVLKDNPDGHNGVESSHISTVAKVGDNQWLLLIVH